MIRLENVTKIYKGEKLSLCCEELTLGEGVHAVLGDDGAGKTTLAGLICGTLRPSSGSVTVDGHPAHSREAIGLVGAMPESSVLEPHLTALEALTFFARLRGLSASHALGALETAGLSETETKLPCGLLEGLSAKKLSLALALLGEPRYLVLDQPLCGLEPSESEELTERLRLLSVTHGLVYTTDSPEEAAALCDTVTVLSAGRPLVTCPIASLGDDGDAPCRFRARIRAGSDRLSSALKASPHVRSHKLSTTTSETLLLDVMLDRSRGAADLLTSIAASSGGELLELKRADTPLEAALAALNEKDSKKNEDRRERDLQKAPPLKLDTSLITFRHEHDDE